MRFTRIITKQALRDWLRSEDIRKKIGVEEGWRKDSKEKGWLNN